MDGEYGICIARVPKGGTLPAITLFGLPDPSHCYAQANGSTPAELTWLLRNRGGYWIFFHDLDGKAGKATLRVDTILSESAALSQGIHDEHFACDAGPASVPLHFAAENSSHPEKAFECINPSGDATSWDQPDSMWRMTDGMCANHVALYSHACNPAYPNFSFGCSSPEGVESLFQCDNNVFAAFIAQLYTSESTSIHLVAFLETLKYAQSDQGAPTHFFNKFGGWTADAQRMTAEFSAAVRACAQDSSFAAYCPELNANPLFGKCARAELEATSPMWRMELDWSDACNVSGARAAIVLPMS